MVNLCFITLEDNNEVLSNFHSSYDDYDNLDDDYDDDNDYNNESSTVSKLMLKCKNLLSKKKVYKLEL